MKDIIAGHIGTCQIVDDRDFHDIYYDGESHYYLDGTVALSRVIPVIMYNTETKNYYNATTGKIILAYKEEY